MIGFAQSLAMKYCEFGVLPEQSLHIGATTGPFVAFH